ncbi:hypothetical protein ANCCAN_10141 [Ancylostoma caninum]|uniref:Uncharacterized protein n=1 Tax=Ancylostoma caninum TaxID=29170 RepID=A0A368GKT8_ANCCA|nr:hypothetical protein ANCCAN_10141 [Ancylostoma caninum]
MNKRYFQTIVFYEFKLRHNAAEPTVNINWPKDWIRKKCEAMVRKISKRRYNSRCQGGHGRKYALDEKILRDAVERNRESSVRALASELGASKSTVTQHPRQMEMLKKMPN